MIKLVKVLHIHSDKKFLSETLRFQHENFDNTTALLSNEDIALDLNVAIVRFRLNFFTLKKVVSYSEGFDVVVLYDLNTYHIAIANALPSEIKIIWRFFGQELYMLDKQAYLSDLTKEINNITKTSFIKKVQISLSYRIKRQVYCLFFGYNFDLFQSISRISYMMVLFEEEYDFLCKKYTLPQYLPIPIGSIVLKTGNDVRDKILIGNSQNDFNNHFDVLRSLNEVDTSNVIIPLNYGSDSYYAERLKKEAKTQNVRVLDTFLSLPDYENLLSTCSAFVLNAYRQMAVGNIWIALQQGMKIYLNEKNLVYHIFKKHEIEVFTLEDFRKDIESGNTKISLATASKNIESFNFMISNSREKFSETLSELSTNND